MDEPTRTLPAVMVCLAIIAVAFGLFMKLYEWPTGRLVGHGAVITERDILVYDILPIVAGGFLIGLVAIAATRFLFPRSSITAILAVVGAFAGLASLAVLFLAAVIGAQNIRDYGMVAMILAVPLAIAVWAGVAMYVPQRRG